VGFNPRELESVGLRNGGLQPTRYGSRGLKPTLRSIIGQLIAQSIALTAGHFQVEHQVLDVQPQL